MASLFSTGNRTWCIQFEHPNGGRRSFRPGKMSERQAETVKQHVEELASAKASGVMVPRSTAAWVDGLGQTQRERLAKCGLVEHRELLTVAEWVKRYNDGKVEVKTNTMKVMRQAERHLARHMGDRELSSVTAGDADAYRSALGGEKRARATVSKWCGYAKQFFGAAVKAQLIDTNPFEHHRRNERGGAKAYFDVPEDWAWRIIDEAPDPQWKLMIGLGRWGGLRMMSEAVALRWADVDFSDPPHFTVNASKTEHHESGGPRLVPMFPELVPLFQLAYDDAPEGSEHIIRRYRDPDANTRTQLNRYVKAAGLKPWPKPWQNMRATRANEVEREYGQFLESAWIGHTAKVARSHYLHVNGPDMIRATDKPEALQKAVQRLHVGTGHVAQGNAAGLSQPSVNARVSETMPNHAQLCGTGKIGAAGFEPATEPL